MYDRNAAVEYAHKYAHDNNPAYMTYEGLGGDCTNFISQCLYAGGAQMNFTPDFGWYYIDGNDKAPAWTGVEFLYNFLTANKSVGPYGIETTARYMMPGDKIQLSFNNVIFGHSLFVVKTGRRPSPRNILIATHTDNSDFRPLITYLSAAAVRYIHILGSR